MFGNIGPNMDMFNARSTIVLECVIIKESKNVENVVFRLFTNLGYVFVFYSCIFIYCG
jgi:hypothetical protein